jgi:hypothetical protein
VLGCAGNLTEREIQMPTLMLAMLTPAEGREADFNRWYDEVHAAEALSTPGLASITRYKMSDLVLFPGTEISTAN